MDVNSAKVLILTGPCGSGKSTIAKLIAKHSNFEVVSGDDIKGKLFPDIGDITEFPEKLEKVKEQILKNTQEHFNNGKNVIVDYVILGKKQIENYRNLFKSNLIIKVLLPEKDELIQRDKNRDCWTAGHDCTSELFEKFERLKGYIGKDNFIDTTNETPKETYVTHFQKF